MGAEEEWALAEQHRLAQAQMTLGVGQDVLQAWELLDFGRLDATFPRYAERLAASTQARRSVSSALGLSYYARAREAAEVGGSFARVAAPRIEPERLVTSLSVTGPGTVKRALASGASPAEAISAAQSATQGAIRRHVLDGGRESVLRTMMADDRAQGYQRVSDGSPCAFCAMLVSRGAVYKKDTGFFKSHDRCGCTAKPFWELDPAESQAAADLRALWDATGGNYSGDAALREFRRAYSGRTAGLDLPDGTRRVIDRVAKPSNSDFLPGGSRRLESVDLQIGQVEETIARLEREGGNAAALDYNRKRLADLIAERESLGGAPVKSGPSVLRTGHYAPEDWPTWARESRLAELLDELPEDRTLIGAPKPVEIPDFTEEDALRESMRRAAVNAGYADEAAWVKQIESDRASLERMRTREADAEAVLRRLEAEHGNPAGYEGDVKAQYDANFGLLSMVRSAIDTMESRVDDYERVVRRMKPGDLSYISPARLRSEFESKIPWKMEIDDAGLPTGDFARQMDVLDEIGRTVDAEVTRRWKERYPDLETPIGHEEAMKAWGVEAERRENEWLAALDNPDIDGAELDRLEDAYLNFDAPTHLTDAQVEEHALLTREVISEIRPMTSRETAQRLMRPARQGEIPDGDSGVVRLADEAVMGDHWDGATYFPAAWGDALEDALEGRPYRVGVNDRGYNNFTKREMLVSGSGADRRATAVHEIGHGMEAALPQLSRVEFALLSRRAKRQAADGNLWEKAVGIRGPGDSERSIPSGFAAPYTSRVYGNDDWRMIAIQARTQYYEVFTTGTQVVYGRTMGDIRRYADREFRESILGWLLAL